MKNAQTRRWRSLKFAGISVLALRLVTSLYLALITGLMPISKCSDFPCYQPVLDELNSNSISRLFLAPWYRWDSVHYLDLAQSEYHVYGIENTVWPPLYPIMIRAFSSIMPPMAAALIVSTLSTFIALFFLHKEVSIRWGESHANWAVGFLVTFPTAFFLVGAYSEALFLALSLTVFSALRQERWLIAGGLAVLATLTRLQGVLLALPIAWQGLQRLYRFIYPRLRNQLHVPGEDIRINHQGGEKSQASLLIAPLLSAVLPPLALIGYFITVHFALGAPWPWQTLTSHWGQHFGWPGQGIWGNILVLFRQKFSLIQISVFFDLFIFLLFFILLIKKKPGFQLPTDYLVYGWVMLILPSLRISDNWNTLTSISRYAVLIFPAFIVLAFSLKKSFTRLTWLVFSMISQLLLLFLFTRWIWVA